MEGTAHYAATSGRTHTTNPPQQPESELREQRGVHPTPVKPTSTGHSYSCTVATVPDTAPLVDPSAFAHVLGGFAAVLNPTLIRCFHSSRTGLEDNANTATEDRTADLGARANLPHGSHIERHHVVRELIHHVERITIG